MELRIFSLPNEWQKSYCFGGLSGGVMVALGPLEASVMVRIHAGQPIS